MKEHAQEYGVRRWAGDDLIELQSEPLEAIQKLVEPYAPCIIQGCEVDAAEKRIGSGMVALWEVDEDNRKKGVKIARFEGCVTETFPVYLTLKRTPEERVYVDGKNKPIAYDYTAQETTVENDVKDNFPLKITEDGGPRLPESLTVNFTAATIRENIQPNETLGMAFGKIKKWFSDLKSHAFRAIVKEDLDADLKTELDGKVDKEENKGLSTADFTHEEKAKLQGIADKANNYTLPTASSSVLGGIKTNYAANGKNYKVSVDGNGNAYVNVPWTDTDTKYGAATQSVAGLMSIADKKKLDGIADGANKTTVDSALSGTSTNPVQNMAVKTELDKKVPVPDSETAFRMLLSLGNKVCLSSSASDKITTNMYGRGGTRTTSEQAIGFLLVLKDKWEYICLIGRTTSSVTMGNFNTSYTNNNIYITKDGLYVNVINKSGALQNDALRFYKDGGTTSTLFYTKTYVNIPTGNELSMLNDILLVPILVAAATGWSPNATASADGFMSAADKTKLDGIATGANRTEVDTALSTTSTNPVQNKIVKEALDGKAASSHTHSYLPLSGGTVTGDVTMQGKVRLQKKQVSGSTDHYLSPRLNFGDGEEVYMEEATDGHLTVYGKNSINLSTSTGISTIKVNGTAIKDALPTATTSASGLMSAADKKKLDTMQNPIPVGVYFLGPDGLRHSHGKDIKVDLNKTTKIYTIQVDDSSGAYTFLPLSYNGTTIVFNNEYINANNDFKIDCYIRTLDSSSKLATYTGFVMFQLS